MSFAGVGVICMISIFGTVMFLQIQRQTADVAPETLGSLFGLPVTNTFIASILITLVLVGVSVFVIRRASLVPGRFQNMVEVLYEKMAELVEQITGDEHQTQFIFPIVAALFVFIGAANLFGLIPGITSITWNDAPLLRTATTDLNLTLGLAVAMVVLVQIKSIQDYGLFGYIGRFIRIKELWYGFRSGLKDGMLSLVNFFVGFLDIVGEFAKAISLGFRLFGNIFAGELLAILILGAVAYVVPALWLSVNLLFAVVQAIVFGALVAAYYTLSVRGEDECRSDEMTNIKTS